MAMSSPISAFSRASDCTMEGACLCPSFECEEPVRFLFSSSSLPLWHCYNIGHEKMIYNKAGPAGPAFAFVNVGRRLRLSDAGKGRHLLHVVKAWFTAAFRHFAICRRKPRAYFTAAFRHFAFSRRKPKPYFTAAFRHFAFSRRKLRPYFTAAFRCFAFSRRKPGREALRSGRFFRDRLYNA